MKHNTINAVQKEFLKILECFIHEKSCVLSEDFSAFEELYKMAVMHKVASAVYEKIWKDGRVNEQQNTLVSQWKRRAIMEVSLQVQRTNEFLKIYQKLNAAGVRPLIVKGIIRREMYAMPDYCTSADEDLLIREEDFAKCDEILLAEGFRREKFEQKQIPMEVSYFHPQTAVYLEVHRALFAGKIGTFGDLNQDFAQAFENCICENIRGVDVWTLNPALHMWYLICHSLKHFLSGGFGVRQICDMVKMAEYYGEQIDWSWIKKRLEELQLETYWGAIMDIACKYLNYVPGKEVPFMKVDGTEFLLDLFESGIYGSSSIARKQSANMTISAAKRGKKNTAVSLLASLFPGREYMCRKYPYLEKYPWLFPVASIQRIGHYMKTKEKHDSRNSISIGMQRVELLKKYHLIRE